MVRLHLRRGNRYSSSSSSAASFLHLAVQLRPTPSPTSLSVQAQNLRQLIDSFDVQVENMSDADILSHVHVPGQYGNFMRTNNAASSDLAIDPSKLPQIDWRSNAKSVINPSSPTKRLPPLQLRQSMSSPLAPSRTSSGPHLKFPLAIKDALNDILNDQSLDLPIDLRMISIVSVRPKKGKGGSGVFLVEWGYLSETTQLPPPESVISKMLEAYSKTLSTILRKSMGMTRSIVFSFSKERTFVSVSDILLKIQDLG